MRPYRLFTRGSYGYGRSLVTASRVVVKAVRSSSRRALNWSCGSEPANQSWAPLARSVTRVVMPSPPKAAEASADHA